MQVTHCKIKTQCAWRAEAGSLGGVPPITGGRLETKEELAKKADRERWWKAEEWIFWGPEEGWE